MTTAPEGMQHADLTSSVLMCMASLLDAAAREVHKTKLRGDDFGVRELSNWGGSVVLHPTAPCPSTFKQNARDRACTQVDCHVGQLEHLH